MGEGTQYDTKWCFQREKKVAHIYRLFKIRVRPLDTLPTHQVSLHLTGLSLLASFLFPHLTHVFPFPVSISHSRLPASSSHTESGRDKAKEKFEQEHQSPLAKAVGRKGKQILIADFPVPNS
jgi:hypothetical protein